MKKVFLIVAASLIILYVGDVSGYSNNPKSKKKLPKNLMEKIIEDTDSGRWLYQEYKGNINKISKNIKERHQDLNNDKEDEYFILAFSVEFCGTGGCELWIYHKGENTYKAIHPVDNETIVLRGLDANSMKVLKTSTNGYFDLECFEGSKFSYQGIKKVVLKFNGTRYSRVS
jgi:hypothetical protein